MKSKRNRIVIRLSLDKLPIQEFNSLKDVCIFLNVSQSYSSYLLKTIKSKKVLRGSYWQFKEHVDLKEDELFICHSLGFSVSNYGTIKSKTGYLTKGCVRSGYMSYTIGRRSWYVHRLVAEVFIPNPNNEPTVNHLDKNKFNNKVENLEWASYKRQANHRDE